MMIIEYTYKKSINAFVWIHILKWIRNAKVDSIF